MKTVTQFYSLSSASTLSGSSSSLSEDENMEEADEINATTADSKLNSPPDGKIDSEGDV